MITTSRSLPRLSVAVLAVAACLAHTASAETDYAKLASPLIGTDSEFRFSNGNTYPAVAAPFGMTFWTPRTGDETGWIYQYGKDKLRGFHATHQPSPWMGDYGNFGIMPFVDGPTGGALPSSKFSHDTEESKPYYYGVTLEDTDIRAEMTATTRCAAMRFTYPQGANAWVHFDAYGATDFDVDEDKGEIRATGRFNRGGVEGDFGCRFLAKFNCKIADVERSGDRHWIAVKLDLGDKTTADLVVGSSFISFDQAQVNLDREIDDKSFDQVVADAKAEWNKRLSVIDIEGATDEQMVTFYSNMYRALLFPRILYEFDANGEMVHYSPYSGKVEPGEMYADNGFWDTFRAVYPLLSVVDPEINASMVRGWINAYKEGGWFPKWASPGYRDCMIGTHVESVVADALCKGITDFDLQAAADASIKDATEFSDNGAYGRKGLREYINLGYVASDRTGEATARTLEFAYDDWCAAQVCKAAGRDDVVPMLLERAQNYHNVFDPEVGFMRGREASGKWRPDFKADEWGGPFTEGSSWHYSWSVLHDLPGLIQLMGGDQAFVDKLDAMLAAEPTFDVGHYGGVIHEMTEMVACNMGQYAHGNQPVHHVLYLYNFGGQPWKTAAPVRKAVDTLYGAGPDGYCGDEDNGQMSAWYVFSTLGFYPVCPGKPGYVLGSPRFAKATIHLQNGKDFVIEADGNSDEAIHIQSMTLDGKPVTRSWISHNDITSGGVLKLEMGKEPNKEWGNDPADRPFGDFAE
ncbi:GH92 family glycosyl hydrolase [Aeoliella sp. ICT_H6.2]|uniref:GH92 family glycosyl hydrolase n=1 Tax=Aeoliella straminimaris TaxID=2954799 RepID=A0A9X2JFF7_9BACT|nr:GH92 family glycosyl hydrolase [Aeoliella straminimaris]MCO6043960.1 GH92 family glycosyl hydrolase [Aeoliella straminimaris]